MTSSDIRTRDVRTAEGLVRGRSETGLHHFRRIPYARPPVGEWRFAAPQPHAPWDGVRDATTDGPIAPQGKSRLALVMGDFERPQSEDCLTLNVWTPAPDDAGRPVMVWLHGGAYMSGAGSLDWYDGSALARAGDVVVVSVNYRLGALGFLRLAGVADGNMGLLDQIEALRWVKRNIAAFGGDPGRVTVFGQSAGAAAIAAMLTMPAAKGLFRHAILQSPGMGRPTRPAPEADEIGERFRAHAGVDAGPGCAAALRALPVERLLDAQGRLARELHAPTFASLPFMPVVDGNHVQATVTDALAAGAAAGIPTLIGTTREEMAAFFRADPTLTRADDAMMRQVFEATLGEDVEGHLDDYRRGRASTANAALLGDLLTDAVFRIGSLRFAEAQARHRTPCWVYQFDWQSPQGVEACHCIEIPFVFGNPDAWRDAPMVAGIDDATRDGLTRAMQGAWIAFARSGDPNHAALPRWPAYEPTRRSTMRFDRVCGPLDDLAGIGWRRRWPQ
ncbi:MAG: carboxylesterase/lipase family protein [Lautropia sp.]